MDTMPKGNFAIAILITFIIIIIRVLFFDLMLYEKFEEKTDNKERVVLSKWEKISIKLLSVVFVIITMFVLKKLILTRLFSNNEESTESTSDE